MTGTKYEGDFGQKEGSKNTGQNPVYQPTTEPLI